MADDDGFGLPWSGCHRIASDDVTLHDFYEGEVKKLAGGP